MVYNLTELKGKPRSGPGPMLRQSFYTVCCSYNEWQCIDKELKRCKNGLVGNHSTQYRYSFCLCVKRKEWTPRQQMMVLLLNICVFKDGTAKFKKGRCRHYV